MSPTIGWRVERVFTLTMRAPSGLMLVSTESTTLVSCRTSTDLSRFTVLRCPLIVASALLLHTVLPMMASPVCTTLPTGNTPVAVSLP